MRVTSHACRNARASYDLREYLAVSNASRPAIFDKSGKKLEKLRALITAHSFERLVARLEAFSPGAIPQDDFVPIEHDEVIVDRTYFENSNTRQADQALCCDKNLAFSK